MIIRYTEEEFNKAKSTDLLPLECEFCGRVYYKEKKEIKYTLNNPSRNRCRFCSTECFTKFNKKELHETVCTQCGKKITVSDNDFRKSETKRFFCSRSCAAKYNNKLRQVSDEQRAKTSATLRNRYCCCKKEKCGADSKEGSVFETFVTKISDDDFKNIISTSKTWKSIGEKLGYISNLSSNIKETIRKRCEELGVTLVINERVDILTKTKGEIFSYRKNWQSARSSIRNAAQKRYFAANKEPKCAICGYNKHVEVAHIKAVSDFDDNATIDEINSLDNMIGLCPNHHWEYDNGLLKLQ